MQMALLFYRMQFPSINHKLGNVAQLAVERFTLRN